MTFVSLAGESRAAWISHYGIYMTNGQTIARISDNLDWSRFEGTDKSNWVLHWDWLRLCLVMAYSESGSTNDRFELIHLAHFDEDSQPVFTGPHPGHISCLASGQVGSNHRLYSGHTSDGNVYVENNPAVGTDASNSTDANGSYPVRVETGRFADTDDEICILDGFIHHSDEPGETATITLVSGRDTGTATRQEKTKTVALSGERRTQFDLSRSGDWVELTLVYNGDELPSFGPFELNLKRAGKQGLVTAR